MKSLALLEILGICISLVLVEINSLVVIDSTNHDTVFTDDTIRIDGNAITLWLKKPNGGMTIRKIKIGGTTVDPPAITQQGNIFNATWSNGLSFTIHAESTNNSNVRVYRTDLHTPLNRSYLELCEEMGDYNWYGGGETATQAWPIQNQKISLVAFVPNQSNGGALERYFLSSQGISYYVYERVPLFIVLEPSNGTMCFRSEFKHPYRNTNNRDLVLPIHIVIGKDLLTTHKFSASKYFPLPLGIPEEGVFRDPIWSTWAKYKQNISQELVMNFSKEVDDRGFPVSQIEIDDKWESCYGSEEFDPVTSLTKMSYRILLKNSIRFY